MIQTYTLFGQTYTEKERKQGYVKESDSVTFIFDPALYSVKPHRVVVTGSFRNWNQKMDDPEWLLSKSDNCWIITVYNTDNKIIRPHDQFKFRIDDGAWLEPPHGIPNKLGGDLIFEPHIEKVELKAELKKPHVIWANISPNRPLNISAYKVRDAQGKSIAINGIIPIGSSETMISTSDPMDLKRVYFLEIPELGLKSFCSYDGWFRETYSVKELGANIYKNKTIFRIFSPRAEMIRLYLYKGKDDKKAYSKLEMKQDAQGVWELEIDENLHGVYYDFTVHGANDPGNHFYESNPVHITDPYARVSDNTWGKARIWQKTIPATPLVNGIPKMQDLISYEVHVQDFTDQLPLQKDLKGSFKGMTKKGLRNSHGQKIGFDYLIDLGINTVHLLPVQEYLHFPDDDWKASFQDDPYMIDQGISEENYQWGYRTSHFFAIESKYRTKTSEPGAERDEFRDLVQAFHDQGMAVIIDIVPNHTAENMDDVEMYFNFNVLDKMYYYRTKNFKHIGEYGNEVKTENRPMVQRWLIDQCKHFIEEFGIDGFRIDLAGQIDKQSLCALKEALGDDIIVYGEPWISSNDPAFESNPDWDWYKHDSPITFFQDDARNAIKGPVFELKHKKKDRGWSGGKFSERQYVMKALSSKFPDDKTPLSGISYLDIHDNFTLADQFGTKGFDGRTGVDEDAYKLAVALLYTSLGPIVTHGGSEIMRSKAHAPLKEVVKKTKAGFNVYLHGYRDTYNHRKANQFIWETVGQIPNELNTNNYQNMHSFWKGMNAFRNSKYGKVFRVAEAVSDHYFQWITPEEEGLLGYIVDNQVFVLLNAGKLPHIFLDITLASGKWKLIATNEKVDHLNGIAHTFDKLRGARNLTIPIPGQGLMIWVLE